MCVGGRGENEGGGGLFDRMDRDIFDTRGVFPPLSFNSVYSFFFIKSFCVWWGFWGVRNMGGVIFEL